MTTFSSLVSQIAWFENNGLKAGEIYYEASTGTINFGYGINLTDLIDANFSSNGSSVTFSLPQYVANALAEVGITLTQSQMQGIYLQSMTQDYLQQNFTTAQINTLYPQGFAAATDATGTSIQNGLRAEIAAANISSTAQVTAANDATQGYVNANVVTPLQNIFGASYFNNLPSGVRQGLEDVYYNGPANMPAGSTLRADIQNGNFVDAALQIANNTGAFSDTPRALYDGLSILGVTPYVNGNNQVVSVQFPNDSTVTGSVKGIDASTVNGSAFIDFSNN